jgi:predicted  nucleic acid-binding Zn-ribbon protein
MIFKKIFSRNEERLKRELAKKDNELTSLRFNIAAWQKIHEADIQALRDAQNEITGLIYQIDKKEAVIEDLKEQIRGAAS